MLKLTQVNLPCKMSWAHAGGRVPHSKDKKAKGKNRGGKRVVAFRSLSREGY